MPARRRRGFVVLPMRKGVKYLLGSMTKKMADQVMELLNAKYLIRPISYKGLERQEPLEYPEKALREMILNSIIHKGYTDSSIFLRIFDDQ